MCERRFELALDLISNVNCSLYGAWNFCCKLLHPFTRVKTIYLLVLNQHVLLLISTMSFGIFFVNTPTPTDLSTPRTIMDMRNNQRRNVSTLARLNFSQSEMSSLLSGRGGYISCCYCRRERGGGELTEKISPLFSNAKFRIHVGLWKMVEWETERKSTFKVLKFYAWKFTKINGN